MYSHTQNTNKHTQDYISQHNREVRLQDCGRGGGGGVFTASGSKDKIQFRRLDGQTPQKERQVLAERNIDRLVDRSIDRQMDR
jgi:hypothetical protein